MKSSYYRESCRTRTRSKTEHSGICKTRIAHGCSDQSRQSVVRRACTRMHERNVWECLLAPLNYDQQTTRWLAIADWPLHNRQLIAVRASFAHVNMEGINEPQPESARVIAPIIILFIDYRWRITIYAMFKLPITRNEIFILCGLSSRSKIAREQRKRTFSFPRSHSRGWQKLVVKNFTDGDFRRTVCAH